MHKLLIAQDVIAPRPAPAVIRVMKQVISTRVAPMMCRIITELISSRPWLRTLWCHGPLIRVASLLGEIEHASWVFLGGPIKCSVGAPGPHPTVNSE